MFNGVLLGSLPTVPSPLGENGHSGNPRLNLATTDYTTPTFTGTTTTMMDNGCEYVPEILSTRLWWDVVKNGHAPKHPTRCARPKPMCTAAIKLFVNRWAMTRTTTTTITFGTSVATRPSVKRPTTTISISIDNMSWPTAGYCMESLFLIDNNYNNYNNNNKGLATCTLIPTQTSYYKPSPPRGGGPKGVGKPFLGLFGGWSV